MVTRLGGDGAVWEEVNVWCGLGREVKWTSYVKVWALSETQLLSFLKYKSNFVIFSNQGFLGRGEWSSSPSHPCHVRREIFFPVFVPLEEKISVCGTLNRTISVGIPINCTNWHSYTHCINISSFSLTTYIVPSLLTHKYLWKKTVILSPLIRSTHTLTNHQFITYSFFFSLLHTLVSFILIHIRPHISTTHRLRHNIFSFFMSHPQRLFSLLLHHPDTPVIITTNHSPATNESILQN